MKHIVPILLFVLAVSCSKSEGGSGSTPIVDFSTSTNTIYMGGNVVIPIVLSSPAEKECSVGLKFEGTATKGTDYSVSAESVSFAAGSTVASITITDINLTQGQVIKVALDNAKKLKPGNRSTITITCPGEVLTYNFVGTKGNVIEHYYVKVKFSGSKSGDAWTAPNEMYAPVILTGDGASLLYFCKEDGSADSRGVIINKGSNEGEVCVAVKTMDVQSSLKNAKLSIDNVSDNGFVPGTNKDFSLSVQGNYKLSGRWRFEKFADEDAIKAAFAAAGDDISLLPLSNANFYFNVESQTATGTDGSEITTTTLEPGGTGDLGNFFRKTELVSCKPYNMRPDGRQAGSNTAMENGISSIFFKLSAANRAFSKEINNVGEAYISFRIVEGGKMELTIRDYDRPPFGTNSWNDSSFDVDKFGFTALFTYEK